MLGVLGGLTLPPNTDWGEQMLNTVVGQSIRHLFTYSDAVDVSVQCFPSSKILQGSIDSFRMTGKGLVIRREFEVEEMSFETDAVALDVKALFKGEIRLQAPTQAIAQVKLSEKALNEAFKSELVQKRLVDINIPGLESLTQGQAIAFRAIRLNLLPNHQVQIFAKTDLPGTPDLPISLMATLGIERRRRICFNDATFDPTPVPENLRTQSQVLSEALGKVLNEMVDLDRFNLDGVTLRLNRLETQGKILLLSGYAQIEHFPGTGR